MMECVVAAMECKVILIIAVLLLYCFGCSQQEGSSVSVMQDDSSSDTQDDSPSDVQGDSPGDVQDDSPGDVQDDSSSDVQDDSSGDVQDDSSSDTQDDSYSDVHDNSSGDTQDGGYLVAYEAFLRGERTAKKGDTEIDVWNYAYHIESLDEYYYALFDMNGDGIPELHVRLHWSAFYFILTYYENELLVWYDTVGYEWPTDDGAILYIRPGGAPPHYTYKFKELDFWGNTVFHIVFEKYDINYNYIYDEYDVYIYEGTCMSKEEWDVLTEPYLSATSDLIEWIQLSDDFTHI